MLLSPPASSSVQCLIMPLYVHACVKCDVALIRLIIGYYNQSEDTVATYPPQKEFPNETMHLEHKHVKGKITNNDKGDIGEPTCCD